ncbi:GDP-mannose 4,6-dehydratase [Novosphingobium flavum]|uniref:GDP-mannose 4,6-dehydratase n=1 Tax=Novosphingobium aerophilum TaxID=2839843 RepID=A0A7X1F6Z2_9SPHN|nr:GDP-mannose 4,6-dehydratase [Novosphingobium aerophilum]
MPLAGLADLPEGLGPLTERRILLTGAEGFTGRYLAQSLAERGWQAHGFVRPGTDLARVGGDMACVPVDLRDSAATAEAVASIRPDAVIHLAGISSPVHGSVEEIYATNLIGTRHLLAALAELGSAPRTILASSANVYDAGLSGLIAEDAPVAPVNDYGVSKLAMESLRGVFAARLPIVVTRPFNYTGVGQSTRFVIPKIIAALRAGADSVELGNIDVYRDWSDVRFVSDCYARLVDCPAAVGGTFNICSGVAVSLREVIAQACAAAGRTMEIRFNPQFARANEIPRLWGDHGRLAGVIGPLAPPPIAETLRWMLESA